MTRAIIFPTATRNHSAKVDSDMTYLQRVHGTGYIDNKPGGIGREQLQRPARNHVYGGDNPHDATSASLFQLCRNTCVVSESLPARHGPSYSLTVHGYALRCYCDPGRRRAQTITTELKIVVGHQSCAFRVTDSADEGRAISTRSGRFQARLSRKIRRMGRSDAVSGFV